MEIAKLITEEEELKSIRKINLGKKIVFTSGCFDLLHYGHICHLEESKDLGDILVVAINSDKSVRRLKGNSKPIIPERYRARILQAMRYVDYVFLYEEDDVCRYFKIFYPDIFSIGEESAILFKREIEAAEEAGSEIHIVKRICDFSSTNVIRKIRENSNGYI